MAKGIEINGQLRGKRGGLVYYRQDGEQISRVRNTNPKNPRTTPQMIQRAVTATIMQAYSKGKAIFDHSFEGKSVPSGSMRAFMRENMKMLRAGILKDLKDLQNDVYDDEEALAAASPYRVVSPYAEGPTAAPYIISKGSYKDSPLAAAFLGTNGAFNLTGFEVASAETTVAEAYAANNLREGDILTLCLFHGSMDNASVVSSPALKFSFVRLVAKAPTADVIVGKKLTDLFIVSGAGVDASAIIADLGSSANAIRADAQQITIGRQDDTIYCAGVICSRDDEKLRSTTAMTFNKKADPYVSVTAARLEQSWRNMGEKADSSLILEGGNF